MNDIIMIFTALFLFLIKLIFLFALNIKLCIPLRARYAFNTFGILHLTYAYGTSQLLFTMHILRFIKNVTF